MEPIKPLLIILALAASAAAQVIVNVGPGDYWLHVEPGLTKVTPVPVIGPSGPVIPPVPPAPPAPTLTERGKAIYAEAFKANDPDTAANAAELLRQIVDLIPTTIDSPEKAQLAVRAGLNKVIPAGTADKWKPMRAVLTEQWTDLVQRGGSLEDCSALLSEAAEGLAEAGPDEPQINVAMIMEIIKLILAILEMWNDAAIRAMAAVGIGL